MRRKSRQIRVGQVEVGGEAPISIQTMAKAAPGDIDLICDQLLRAKAAGCDIARIAVPDLAAAATIPEIRRRTALPIVADIHFDHRLAVEAARQGADALRVNPGNLGGPAALRAVVEAAGEAGIPIRVGVNAGSLPKIEGMGARATAARMVETSLKMVEDIAALGFDQLKVSLKAFDVHTTVEANRLFAERSDLPLHVGITEAGPTIAGAVRSAAALSLLLHQGIGDTIRISLTAPPVDEVRAARALLRALGLRRGGAVVSCPTCGRTSAALMPVVERIDALLEAHPVDLTVAVMGCEVNGPGEAREADLGIAFGPKGTGLLFEGGEVLGSFPNARLEEELTARILHRQAEEKHGQ